MAGHGNSKNSQENLVLPFGLILGKTSFARTLKKHLRVSYKNRRVSACPTPYFAISWALMGLLSLKSGKIRIPRYAVTVSNISVKRKKIIYILLERLIALTSFSAFAYSLRRDKCIISPISKLVKSYLNKKCLRCHFEQMSHFYI